VRARSGRWLTLHASLTEPDAQGRTETVVVVEPSRAEDLLELMPVAYDLSPREREVALLVAQGASTNGIAATLHLSTYTVQNHLSRIFDKVGVRNRTALVRGLYLDVLHPAVLAPAPLDGATRRRAGTGSAGRP
jgi:DNA-binding NarL/FixJ family response regulator